MLAPPSLSIEILQRAFRAPNGELGVQLADATEFLAACARDHVAVLGWEAWLIDYAFDPDHNGPTPRLGQWCGLIPLASHESSGVFGGNTGKKRPGESWATFVDRTLGETRDQLNRFEAGTDVDPAWQAYLRANFTLVPETDRLAKL
jgi:hypothetical protein